MKRSKQAKMDHLKEAEALCEGLSDEQDALTRELMTGLADKWTLWTLSVLYNAGQPLRFTRVMEQVEGISQKSLTKTLRQLERNGPGHSSSLSPSATSRRIRHHPAGHRPAPPGRTTMALVREAGGPL